MDEIVESLGNVLEQKFVFPADILEAIKADKQAWENYQKFSEPYKRIRVAFIEGARKRPDEFHKRLNYFIKTARENKLIGFGGIEKYY
jgi:Bacteriocin-protection, YdeI or OmpD-Associated